MSLHIRDQLILECWVSCAKKLPQPDPRGIYYPVSCLGVVDDPRFTERMGGRFVELVSWWPANQIWTVSHQSQACDDVVDLQIRVVAWQQWFEAPRDWP